MRKLLLICLFGLLLFPARASTVVTATVTVTNTAGVVTNGASIDVNGDTRYWLSAVTNSAINILTNGTQSGAASALLDHAAVHPFAGMQLLYAANGLTLRAPTDSNLVVTVSAGWATIVMATNTITSAVTVRIPFTLESAAQQTNIASGLAAAINSTANTNPIVASYALASLNSTQFWGSLNASNLPASYVAPEATHATNADLATAVSGTLTNQVTNVIYSAQSFPSATNTLSLNNGYWTLVVGTDCAITNVAATDATAPCWASLAVSNSSGSAITLRNYAPNLRAIGS